MKLRACLLLIATAWLHGTARAQGSCTAVVGTKCTAAITLTTPNASSMTNPRVVVLTASPIAGTWTVSAANLDAGTTSVVPVTLTVHANRSWRVGLSGTMWTVSGGGSPSKPISDALWSTTSNGTGTALTTVGATVASGAPGSALVAVVYLRSRVGWTDVAGTYTLPLTFTVVTP